MSGHLYVASSWRNEYYHGLLAAMDRWGIPYYNWRDEEGFHWSEVFNNAVFQSENTMVEHVEHWTEPIKQEHFIAALKTPEAQRGYQRDMDHLKSACAVVLLLPSGKSAHLEAAWAVGQDKPVACYAPEPLQPELMYGMFDLVTQSAFDILTWMSTRYGDWRLTGLWGQNA